MVALHHKGGWLLEPGSKQKFYRNQSIHINQVIEGLTNEKDAAVKASGPRIVPGVSSAG